MILPISPFFTRSFEPILLSGTFLRSSTNQKRRFSAGENMNEITLHFTTDVYRIDNQIKDTPTGQKIGEFAEKGRNYTSIKQVGV